jgi:hypothetical protein
MQDGRAKIELRVAFMTGWAPAATQPKPLKPGTGQIKLSDALRDDPAGKISSQSK